MSGVGTPLLVAVFVVAAAATWVAGNALSKTTDALDFRLNLGEELGGLLLLSVAGSLPELAITVSAAASGNLGLAAGNLIGGIAVQTMVLVVCDARGGARAAADVSRRRVEPGARRDARRARRVGRVDGIAAEPVDGDRRRGQPGLDRDRRRVDVRRLRDQQGAEEPAVARHDGGRAPGPPPSPRSRARSPASVRVAIDGAGGGDLRRRVCGRRSRPASCSR